MSEKKWLSELQAYNIQISHIEGKYNNLADHFSRQPIAAVGLRDDSELRRKQNSEAFIKYRERHYPQAVRVDELWVDESNGVRKLIIPEDMQM